MKEFRIGQPFFGQEFSPVLIKADLKFPPLLQGQGRFFYSEVRNSDGESLMTDTIVCAYVDRKTGRKIAEYAISDVFNRTERTISEYRYKEITYECDFLDVYSPATEVLILDYESDTLWRRRRLDEVTVVIGTESPDDWITGVRVLGLTALEIRAYENLFGNGWIEKTRAIRIGRYPVDYGQDSNRFGRMVLHTPQRKMPNPYEQLAPREIFATSIFL